MTGYSTGRRLAAMTGVNGAANYRRRATGAAADAGMTAGAYLALAL